MANWILFSVFARNSLDMISPDVWISLVIFWKIIDENRRLNWNFGLILNCYLQLGKQRGIFWSILFNSSEIPGHHNWFPPAIYIKVSKLISLSKSCNIENNARKIKGVRTFRKRSKKHMLMIINSLSKKLSWMFRFHRCLWDA